MRPPRRVRAIVESTPTVIDVSAAQASTLNQLGKALASKKIWWGKEDLDDAAPEKQVVRCSPRTDGRWDIVVPNAVGIIAADDLDIIVEPKIPTAHAMYLLSRSDQFPRVADASVRTGLQSGGMLWRALAEWFLHSVEKLLRGELIRDYRINVSSLPEARGRIDVFRTTRNFLCGNLRFECEYEEFDSDNALNRILRAAVVIVQQISNVDQAIRDRASRALSRFDDVGPLRPDDLRTRVDRHVKRYDEAIALARNLIRGVGRGLEVGQSRARCFLLRTPELIEAGIRDVLARELSACTSVSPGSRQIAKTKMTLNPDLVFGELAVGDVKYKVSNEWIRSDVYQGVSFAVGFAVKRCALFSFAEECTASTESIEIGNISVTHFRWPTQTTPRDAEYQMLTKVKTWLSSC